MDSGRNKTPDTKAFSDEDPKTHITRFGPGNVRAELPSIWDHAPKEVVGQGLGRLLTRDYCKEDKGEASTGDLMDAIINEGPPFGNVSKPKPIL